MSERYLPDRDQIALARSMGESLRSILPLSRLQGTHDESAATWTALRDLGVLGISTPAEDGGSGLDAAEEALIVIELGRQLVDPSVLATLGATHLGSRGRHLAAESEGREERVAAAYGRSDRFVVVGGQGANLVLVRCESAPPRLFAFPPSSRVLDETLWSTRLLEAAGLGEPLAMATPAEAMRLRLLDAAALAGLAQAALGMAVQYAGVREQFGRAIGSFQAVKHHCANMALAARCACDQVGFAAIAVDDDREDAALQVESALFVAGSAAIENSGKNIQVHGGIGFSEEAVPHRVLKRARVLVQLAGGLEAALSRVASYPPALDSRAVLDDVVAGSKKR
jgi:alkylation response protein AidB-like acyl-CoA dehydrogenase